MIKCGYQNIDNVKSIAVGPDGTVWITRLQP
jgi:hypothetical protein